jgi:non-heme chloroperoxidase
VITPRFSTVSLATGVRLHYGEQGEPAGEPIILLHGYSDSWFSFSRVLELVNRKYRVFALDQRGHGESDRPPDGYGMPDLAADVLAFMDARSLRKATIVGHSMGSFVAQHVAARAPEQVAGLVLVGSAATCRNDVMFELQRAVNALRDPVPEKFARDFQVSTVFHSVPEAFMERAIQESLRLPARVWHAVVAGMVASDATAPLGEIQAPTLALSGDRDSIFSRLEQESLASALPNAVLKIYPQTGHAPHWERPEEFVRDLEDFMNRGAQR